MQLLNVNVAACYPKGAWFDFRVQNAWNFPHLHEIKGIGLTNQPYKISKNKSSNIERGDPAILLL
jgi:hypothetical protein